MNHALTPSQHVCFSGSASCSGCNPCPECHAHQQENVLPSAFLASRMSETLVALHSLIGSLLERGVDPRQLGVDLSRVFPTLEEQANEFFRGYNEGWARMHEGMRTNPNVRARLMVCNVVGEGHQPAEQRPAHESPGQGEVPVSPQDPWKAALEEQQKAWEAEEAVQVPEAPEPPPAPKPQPITLSVEDVAAAGAAMPLELLRNGSAS